MGMKISMMNSEVLKQNKFSVNVSNSMKEGMLKQEKIWATTAEKSVSAGTSNANIERFLIFAFPVLKFHGSFMKQVEEVRWTERFISFSDILI